jgi:hypothetical protein
MAADVCDNERFFHERYLTMASRGHPHCLRKQTAWYEVLGASRGTSHAVRTRPTRVICFRIDGRHIARGRRQKRGALHPRRHTPQVQSHDQADELRGDVPDRSTAGHPHCIPSQGAYISGRVLPERFFFSVFESRRCLAQGLATCAVVSPERGLGGWRVS